jgi:hypothetical protein
MDNYLIDMLEDLSLTINIELVEGGVDLDITHIKLLTKVRNQIDELTRVIITQELNNIRESI